MKRIYLFLTAALAIMLAPSCEQMPQEGLPVAGTKEIKLSAGLGAYTKATDTEFENGDAIGLNIIVEQPYLENAKFTMTGGALTPDETYFWYDDSSLKSTVFAYYPYSKDFKYDYSDFEFTVNADQSTHKYYTQSDLMMAKVEGVTPTEETVYLPFNHMLSKVVISIENNLGEGIDAVYFSNVYGSVNINPVTMEQTVTGSKGTIKTARAYDEKGMEVWTLILAPQAEALPELIVTTASQKQMTFTLSNPVTFSAGRQSTANVVLDAETLQTDFTPEITDWLPDNELNFGQEGDDVVVPEPEPEVSIWGVVGTFTGWGSEPDKTMVYDEKYKMFRSDTLYFTPEDAFKVRSNNVWDDTANYGIEYGLTAKTFINVAIPVFTGGNSADIKPGVYGVYSVWFDLENSFVYILEEGVTPDMAGDITLEEVEHTWGLIGSFNGWAEDYPTTIVDGVAVAEGVTLEAGAEFKFRADGAWGIDYGTAAVHESGEAVQASLGGGNCSVAVAGVYDVYLNLETFEITVVLVEGTGEVPVGIIDDGQYWIVEGTKFAMPADASYTYGYLPSSEGVISEDGSLASLASYAFTFKYVAEHGGYTIQDSYGRYLYNDFNVETGEVYHAFNFASSLPADETVGLYIWGIDTPSTGTYTDGEWDIFNIGTYYSITYTPDYGNWGIYDAYDSFPGYPTLVKADDPVESLPEPELPAGPVEATIAEFIAAAESSDVTYRVSGTIVSISEISANFQNATFDIADEAGNKCTVYRMKMSADATATVESLGLTVGDYITVEGNRSSYNSVPQMSNGIYVSHEDREAPVSDADVVVDLTAQGYANAAEVTTLTVDGVTLTFDKGTNSNTPKWYNSGAAVRVYGGGTMTVASSQAIEKIVFVYGSSDNTNEITADSGEFSVDTWTGSADSVVFTVGGTSGHRRFAKVEVYYASTK